VAGCAFEKVLCDILVLQERERLARELHDSLGQVLGYANLQIQNIREMLQSDRWAEADPTLVRLSQVILEANTEVGEFIYKVKTALPFKEEFFVALQHYLTRFEQNFQIRTDMQNPDNLFSDWNPLHPASSLNPFRPAETLAVYTWKINSESLVPDARQIADGSAAVLIIAVLIFNLLARYFGRRIQRRLTGQ
jgi:hypothetical protein